MFEVKEPSHYEEVFYFCNCNRLLNLHHHPAGVRQPHDMKTRQRWILLVFMAMAAILLLLMFTGGITKSPSYYYTASPISLTLDLDQLSDREKCPACFGVKMCPQIVGGRIKLSDWTKYKLTRYVNQKNIFYGQWEDGLIQRKVKTYILSYIKWVLVSKFKCMWIIISKV